MSCAFGVVVVVVVVGGCRRRGVRGFGGCACVGFAVELHPHLVDEMSCMKAPYDVSSFHPACHAVIFCGPSFGVATLFPQSTIVADFQQTTLYVLRLFPCPLEVRVAEPRRW